MNWTKTKIFFFFFLMAIYGKAKGMHLTRAPWDWCSCDFLNY